MTQPERAPKTSGKENPLSDEELIQVAQDFADSKNDIAVGFLASFSSLLSTGMLTYEMALDMIRMNPSEAHVKLQEIRQKQAESLRQNTQALRTYGTRAIATVMSLNPLEQFKKK